MKGEGILDNPKFLIPLIVSLVYNLLLVMIRVFPYLVIMVNITLFIYSLLCPFFASVLIRESNQKRFYTRETLRGIWILQFAKISTLYRDWLR